DPGFQRAFRQEARIIAGFNHPNIVRVHDIEERYRTLFIIMEYLEGVSLRYLLDHGPPLSYQRILSILIQACAGLDYAHKKGIVHRDIKPANLFLLSGDQVKILDFGVAAPTGAEAGNVAGTIHYLAPEQIACDPVDERIDIYALGISAYEMVTGQRPYCADDPESLITMHLRAFIITACRRDPDERYRDFGEAVQELQSLADKFGMKVENGFPQKKKMTTINLVYDDSDQDSVNRLLEEFSAKAEKLGIMLKTSNLRDLPK
ncbi:MAG: serine/threonine protein kinase, partial [Deltaproteobacteria bacterium]|nr:serine/threonine protein kinase [Deltaproteobacteria bacterium]